jgi:hypothetical protein
MGEGMLVSQTANDYDPRVGVEPHTSNGQILATRLHPFSIDPSICDVNLVANVRGKLVCYEDGPAEFLADGQTEISAGSKAENPEKANKGKGAAEGSSSFSFSDPIVKICGLVVFGCVVLLWLSRTFSGFHNR